MFSYETTWPIFTKILHDIVALVALFNHAHTQHYAIRFRMPERLKMVVDIDVAKMLRN